MPLVVAKVLPRQTLKYTCVVIFTLAVIILQGKFLKRVVTPFIDEIFHLRQSQTYCQGKFFKWDSKITTPPGLYLASYVYIGILEYFSDDYLCSYFSVLRSFNLVGGILVLPYIVSKFKTRREFWSVNVVSQPILFTYYFLFYTDVWSTVLIIAALALVAKKREYTKLSAFIAFLSLWFRQTNIVWIAFILAVYIDGHATSTHFVTRSYQFVVQLFKRVPRILPFLINFALFALFLKVNGGITFGDKENHKIRAHVVQIFYCFVFLNVFTLPVWLTRKTIVRYFNFLVLDNNGINLVANFIVFVGIKFIIDKFTIVHPFLLADNRHFTFYIWKKLLSHPQSWVAAVPVYHFSTWNVIRLLLDGRKLSLISVLAYLVAVVLTLVPSPLFEPRYYIVPLIVLRLFIKPESRSTKVHLLEFIWLNLINLVTMTVFFKYEFVWDSEPGAIQRIIW